MHLSIDTLDGTAVADRPVEMVERKGIGHPDTICDSLAERLSAVLCRTYRKRAGAILHHNVDKVLLAAGASKPRFGGGRVTAPMEIHLAGRATMESEGDAIPVEALAREACGSWFREHLHALDPDRDVRLHCHIRPGSAELVELYRHAATTGIWLANDTSMGVGFAPRTPLESAVFAAERALNAAGVRQELPALGEDVKVLGLREGRRMALTVACAMVDRYLADASAYEEVRKQAATIARIAAEAEAGGQVEVAVNTADDPEAGAFYLTVTGTSAEAGDDGQTGRGNRASGLITPGRPMTLEGIAGKNPMTHVGKLYNVAADLLARALVAEIDEVAEAECMLASRIGAPVDEPQMVSLRLRPRPAPGIRRHAEAIVRRHLSAMSGLWRRFAEESLPVV